MSLHNTALCCVRLSQFSVWILTVKVELSRKKREKKKIKYVAVFWNSCFVSYTENSHFHIMWLTTTTSIIPLSLEPTGYTGTADCKSWRRWHAWEKPPYSKPPLSLSLSLHQQLASSSSPLSTTQPKPLSPCRPVIPYDFPVCIILFFPGDIPEHHPESAIRKRGCNPTQVHKILWSETS